MVTDRRHGDGIIHIPHNPPGVNICPTARLSANQAKGILDEPYVSLFVLFVCL